MVAVRGWQRGSEDLLLTGIELNKLKRIMEMVVIVVQCEVFN